MNWVLRQEQEPSAGISSLVHNPSVLILDEATSALDNASQAVLTQAMQALNQNREPSPTVHYLSGLFPVRDC